MMKKEFFSRGNNASVFRIAGQEKLWFPQADLVRQEDAEMAEDSFAGKYYKHKIASLLFPDNFITVVAGQEDPLNRRSKLFSKLAPIPADHAVFAQHIKTPKAVEAIRHECKNCTSHWELHEKKDLAKLAFHQARVMNLAGIYPPHTDPTDYCLTDKGDLIFFEIEHFYIEFVRKHLESLRNDKMGVRQALSILDRIEDLQSSAIGNLFAEGVGRTD